MYQIDNTPYVLKIAKQGEYGMTHQFDVSEWLSEYPGASIGIVVVRPTETEEDIRNATTILSNTTLNWQITSWDTEIPGYGKAEARLTTRDENNNDIVRKSATLRIYVEPSISEGTPSDPNMAFLNQVIAFSGIANDGANTATAAADRAEAAATYVDGCNLTAVSFVGDDMVFSKENNDTITLSNAKTALKGDPGENQVLSFDKPTCVLTISNGNSVTLNRGLTDAQYSHLTTIMARPYGTWTLTTDAVYSQSSPSRDVPGRKSCRVEWGLGIVHLDFIAALTSGTIGSIPSTGPKAEILIEEQLHDGATVWIDQGTRAINAQGLQVGQRYLFNIIGFFVH